MKLLILVWTLWGILPRGCPMHKALEDGGRVLVSLQVQQYGAPAWWRAEETGRNIQTWMSHLMRFGR